MAYDLYPAVNEDYEFAPEVRAANAKTVEFRNQVIPMTQTQRNNLSGPELWDGRLVMNTTTQRIDRYDDATDAWVTVTTEPAGCIKAWLTGTPPEYHALLDGSSVSRTGIYAALFAKWGTTFNTGGEASDHFRLPNMKGKMPIGLDSASSTDPTGSKHHTLGLTGGEKTHVLTDAEMPAHGHAANTTGGGGVDHLHSNTISDGAGSHVHGTDTRNSSTGADYATATGKDPERYNPPGRDTHAAGGHNHSINNGAADRSLDHNHGISVAESGSDAAHNNLPPFFTVHWIVTL